MHYVLVQTVSNLKQLENTVVFGSIAARLRPRGNLSFRSRGQGQDGNAHEAFSAPFTLEADPHDNAQESI